MGARSLRPVTDGDLGSASGGTTDGPGVGAGDSSKVVGLPRRGPGSGKVPARDEGEEEARGTNTGTVTGRGQRRGLGDRSLPTPSIDLLHPDPTAPPW